MTTTGRKLTRQFLLALPGGQSSPLTHFGCGWGYFLGGGTPARKP